MHSINSKYPGTASLIFGTLTSDSEEHVQKHEDGDCQKKRITELAEDVGSRNENKLDCHTCSSVNEIQRKRIEEELNDCEISMSGLINLKDPAILVSGTSVSNSDDEQVQQHEVEDCQKKKTTELAEDAELRNKNKLECHPCSNVNEIQQEHIEEELNDGEISMSRLINLKNSAILVSGTLTSDSEDEQVQQHEDYQKKKTSTELAEDTGSTNENELECHSYSSFDEEQRGHVEEESNDVEISVSKLISPKDPASLVSGTFTSNEKALILKLGPCQPAKCVLETRKKRIGKHNRYCSQESFIRKDTSNGRRQWISYSLSKDALFCLPCILFSDPALRGEHIRAAQGHAFTKEGFSNWKKQEEKISDHEKCITHRNSVVAQALFFQQKAVSDLMTKEAKLEIERRKMQVKKNRTILEPIVGTIMLLGRQGLALRGHRETLNSDNNAGNFLETLKFVSQYNSSLKEHLENVKEREEAMQTKVGSTGIGRKRCGRGSALNFLSNRSQNTLVSVIINQLSNMLKEKIQESLSWSLIADTTPDISHHEQLSICVRIVSTNGTVSEHLLFCKRAMGTTAQDLVDLIFSALGSQNISLNKLVAQAYDGASVMSGMYNGLQVLLSARCGRDIPYVHCCSHVLNLVLSDIATVATDVVTLFGNLETLYLLFTKSNPIHRIFEEVQNSNKLKVRSMKRLNTIRWHSRENCLNVFLERYDCVIQTLQKIVKDTSFNYKQRTEASGLLHSIQTKQFLATAYLFKRIFEVTGPLSRYLQAVDMDLSKAFAMIDTAVSSLQEMRCNSKEIIRSMEVAHEHHDTDLTDNSEAEESFEIQWRLTRSKDEPEATWTRNTFYVVLDVILTSIKNRFENNRQIFETLAVFSPSYFPILTAKYRQGKDLTPIIQFFCEKFGLQASICADQLLSFAKAYEKLLQHNIDVDSDEDEESEDVESDEVTYTSRGNKTTSVTMTDIGKHKSPLYSAFTLLCNETYRLVDAFPELCKVYSIAMAIPTNSCTAERSFSALKRVKTRLRSTMVQDRLEGLLLMSVERKLLSRIQIESVIDQYALTSKELSKALLY